MVTWPQEAESVLQACLILQTLLDLSLSLGQAWAGLWRLLARVEQQTWTELLQKVGQAPQRIDDWSSEAWSGQMCFYGPLNETNEWGPWPLRGMERSGVEEQLPRVSPEAPVPMLSQLRWGLRHKGLGRLP